MKKTFLLFIVFISGIGPLWSQTGNYLEFNGYDQYMTIANHDDFHIAASESFTVSMWISITELIPGSNQRFIAKRSISTTLPNKSGWELWGGNSELQFAAVNTPNSANNHNNSMSVWADYTGTAGTWTHLAFVVDRGAKKMFLYVNGEKTNESVTNITSWAANNPYDLFVGAGITGTHPVADPNNYFKGKIDDLRIYKRALSAAEIAEDMLTAVSASADGLVAGYDFENISGETVADVTGNHPGILHNFPQPGAVTITTATVIQDRNYSGRGNKNEVILKAVFQTEGTDATAIENIRFSMDGTSSLASVDSIKIYSTGNISKFDPRNPDGVLLGTALPAEGEMVVNTSGYLVSGSNHIWLTYDVSEPAVEGDLLDASLISITTENETYEFTAGNPDGSREVLLRRTLVLAPGDYGSVSYRIPAVITADDGSLVTFSDKRKFGSGDLPEDIDIVCRRSTDGGISWSEPLTIAEGTGYNHGYGDACLLKTNSGRLISLFIGQGSLWNSTAVNPMRSYMVTSDDHGITWSEPVDITSQIYGAGCPDPVRSKWQASFFGSGRGLTLRDGRLMVAIAVREVLSNSILNNYIVYSDDEGETWNVSSRAMQQGDEAKVTELNDGTILLSSRTNGYRMWAKSEDRGITWGEKNYWTDVWGNACNGDMMRYTSTIDGYEKNRLLHTLPNDYSRTKVSMWISYDEGTSWPVKKVLCEGASAYSSVTILPDGTIGVYLEEDETVPYKMYFLNFSLDWLTDGADKYMEPGAPVAEPPLFSLPPGRYAPPQTVEITSATENAEIHYTLDGSTPGRNSALYTGTLILNGSCTLKAVALKEGMANSVVSSVDYIIGYVIPGQLRPVADDRYLTAASTEGGITNISYAATAAPESHYIRHTETIATAVKGDTLLLNLTALPGQEDGLQWCQAIILADWNRDFDFEDEGERIAIVGQRKANNSATVLNISREMVIPLTAVPGLTRLRVVFTDGWRPEDYADFGEDPVDKGRLYDFDLEVKSGVGIEEAARNRVVVVNPVKDELKMALSQGKYEVSLYDLTGRMLLRTMTTGGTVSIPVSRLMPQMLLLQISDNQGNTITRKVVKQ